MLKIGKNGLSLRAALGLKREAIPKGFTAMSEYLPEDVFIVGYPKSGNTWFQHLVSGIVFGVNPKLSPPILVNDLVPDVHYAGFYRRYATPMFFKSHHLPCPEYRRVVYLIRDGRDAMVSFFHFQQALERKQLDFLEFVTTGKLVYPCKWHEHVDAWERNPYGAQMLVIKYEDMLAQPVEQLERFCRFIALPRERSDLAAVAEASKFSNLRDKEARLGDASDKWPSDKAFFRRGVAGSHKDEMPAEVLEAFLKDAAGTLRRCGYAVNEAAGSAAASRGGQKPFPVPG